MNRIISTALVLVVISVLGFAQTAAKEQAKASVKEDAPVVTKAQRGANFIDADGDGVCDNFATKSGMQGKHGKGKGPGNGTGNQGVGPKDGTGYGAGTGNGIGTCDGTGPKGNRGGRK
jgi:type II secretory pathway pseudopilin PulG